MFCPILFGFPFSVIIHFRFFFSGFYHFRCLKQYFVQLSYHLILGFVFVSIYFIMCIKWSNTTSLDIFKIWYMKWEGETNAIEEMCYWRNMLLKKLDDTVATEWNGNLFEKNGKFCRNKEIYSKKQKLDVLSEMINFVFLGVHDEWVQKIKRDRKKIKIPFKDGKIWRILFWLDSYFGACFSWRCSLYIARCSNITISSTIFFTLFVYNLLFTRLLF